MLVNYLQRTGAWEQAWNRLFPGVRVVVPIAVSFALAGAAALVPFGPALYGWTSIQNATGSEIQEPATGGSESAAAAKKESKTESPGQPDALLAEARSLLQADKLSEAD